LSENSDEFSLVQLQLPAGVALTEVRGVALHHWSREETGVQIWLQQPRKQATLELAGWAPMAQKATTSSPGRFLLPQIQATQVRLDSFEIRVLPSPGVAIEVDGLRQLVRGANPNVFVVEGPKYEALVHVRLAPLKPDVRILTMAEVREECCLLVSHF